MAQRIFEFVLNLAALIVLLLFFGSIVRAIVSGLIIGAVERKEYRERERAWKKEFVGKKVENNANLNLAEPAVE